MMLKRAILFTLTVILVAAPRADAAPFTLTDNNSIFVVEPTTQQGSFSWQVDGTEHLYQEWFWYRVFGMNQERSIDRRNINNSTDAAAFVSASQPTPNTLVVRYTHTGFVVELAYDLDGSAWGTGLATLTETISITASGNTPRSLRLDLFEYSNFDVNDTPFDDTASYVSASQITQTDPSSPGSATVTVTQDVPNRYEIAPVTVILDKLNDGVATNLANLSTTPTPPVGPADVAFAFQWTEIIQPGTTWIMTTQKTIEGFMAPVPEPGSMLLLGTGLFGVATMIRRRRKTQA